MSFEQQPSPSSSTADFASPGLGNGGRGKWTFGRDGDDVYRSGGVRDDGYKASYSAAASSSFIPSSPLYPSLSTRPSARVAMAPLPVPLMRTPSSVARPSGSPAANSSPTASPTRPAFLTPHSRYSGLCRTPFDSQVGYRLHTVFRLASGAAPPANAAVDSSPTMDVEVSGPTTDTRKRLIIEDDDDRTSFDDNRREVRSGVQSKKQRVTSSPASNITNLTPMETDNRPKRRISPSVNIYLYLGDIALDY